MFAGQTDHALMNLCGDGRTEQSKAATEDREIWRSVGIEVGETAVHQVAAQFPFQIAEAPALQVLHDTAAQQTIGRHSGSPRTLRKRAACRQTLADQVDQCEIVQQLIDGIEQIVFEQGGLAGQRGIEEPGLVRAGGKHICTRVYRVRSNSQGNNERKLSNFSWWKLTPKDSEPADLPRGCVSDPLQSSARALGFATGFS